MKLRTIEEAEEALLPYVPLVAQLTGQDTTLERIIPLMERLGNPQDKLKVVHIAGTSGKTSTAYYIAALLNTTGCKIGLTVSPHVDSITERVQINGAPIPDAEFCELLAEFLDMLADVEKKPSYFELLYAFSLWVFEKNNVDFAVIETGMGGLHDATNVVTRQDKVCVITDIGFDHMHVLGHTLTEIATQKIGIAHNGNQVYMFKQGNEVMDAVRNYAQKVYASLQILDEKKLQSHSGIDLSSLPDYQMRNWLLAYGVFSAVRDRDVLERPDLHMLAGTTRTYIPGRMDTRIVRGKTVIMDGAHNAQKMATFIRSFRKKYPGERPVILLAMKTGKEFKDVVPILSDVASGIILTKFQTSQDLPAKSIDPDMLANEFQARAPSLPVSRIPDLNDAYAALLQSPSESTIVTGSFYLLSQVRKIKT